MNVSADITSYQARIEAGKQVERRIFASLNQQGVTVKPASSDDDKHRGIDGWLFHQMGQRQSFQLKTRETGNDIIFEAIKDVDNNIRGRDFNTTASLYLVVLTSGKGKLFFAKDIKDWAERIVAAVKTAPARNVWNGVQPWQAKITVDRAHGNRKLMIYMNPSMFNQIKEWQIL